MSETPHSSGQPGPAVARLLVVTAVAAEAEAVLRGADPRGGHRPHRTPALHWVTARPESPAAEVEVEVVAGGVGPAAAAAATATACCGARYDLVVSAGIAGGFAPAAPVGSAVVADAVLAADLGATTAEGFSDVTELGFGTVRHTPPPAAVALAAGALRAAGIDTAVGPVLTVSTVTGTADRTAELAGRHAGAVAEAMEGFGVAEAAARHGLPLLELRTVSNPVGPRDRAAWRIGEALAALERVFAALPYRELIDAAAQERGRP
ncbi:futalosine hydrolase [Peterkaempfera bronchialis]|uniref:Futalosine hydrolase n=1 Tax=Peterkaempfera bronchialis TaxID=2126346 RepID=A0A345SWS4_9ACTN|nr:futalosine hydrolase [Peterkaempfera bronchialis]AXI78179.1 futalosine hydrolase [Peterkaempfera bronchialis]